MEVKVERDRSRGHVLVNKGRGALFVFTKTRPEAGVYYWFTVVENTYCTRARSKHLRKSTHQSKYHTQHVTSRSTLPSPLSAPDHQYIISPTPRPKACLPHPQTELAPDLLSSLAAFAMPKSDRVPDVDQHRCSMLASEGQGLWGTGPRESCPRRR